MTPRIGGHRNVWTFQLIGGESFDAAMDWPITMPTPLSHNGSVSLWSLRLTTQEANSLEEILTNRGIRVNRWCALEEQRAARERQMAVQEGRTQPPTSRCAICFWFDVEAEVPCGIQGLAQKVVLSTLETHPRANEDLQSCPLSYCHTLLEVVPAEPSPELLGR